MCVILYFRPRGMSIYPHNKTNVKIHSFGMRLKCLPVSACGLRKWQADHVQAMPVLVKVYKYCPRNF